MSAYGDTNINGYQGQIKASDQPAGYFTAGTDIMNLISTACNGQYYGSIQRLGIEAPENTLFSINNESIKIGKTGIYQVRDVSITSFTISQDSTKEVVIDYII